MPHQRPSTELDSSPERQILFRANRDKYRRGRIRYADNRRFGKIVLNFRFYRNKPAYSSASDENRSPLPRENRAEILTIRNQKTRLHPPTSPPRRILVVVVVPCVPATTRLPARE